MNEKNMKHIASLAQKALLYEAMLYPKPGLVDPISSGAHKDMDIRTFVDSAIALGDAFYDFVAIGARNASTDPQKVQKILRERGIVAEQEMYRATGGINTHKGIIYSMAFCLCAVGRIFVREQIILSADRLAPIEDEQKTEKFFKSQKAKKSEAVEKDREGSIRKKDRITATQILEEVRLLSAGILERDMQKALTKKEWTTGERLYLEHGLKGARGEVEDGLPTAYRAYEFLTQNGGLDQKNLLRALLLMMQTNCDTNVIARGGFESLSELKERSRRLMECSDDLLIRELQEADRWCIRKNISPGGSADLLSIAIFLYLIH